MSIAIVTGASQGIGLATSRALRTAGWHVVMVARDGDRLKAAAGAMTGPGTAAECISADLADESQLSGIIDRAARLGRIGLLVNNAGGVAAKGLIGSNLADLDQALAIDLRAAWELTRLAAEAMGGAGGAVVNVSSTVALSTPHGRSLYSIAKGAVLAQTKALAIDLADLGIRVNAVCPGPTLTESFAAMSTEEALTTRALSIPLKRLATPDDIANAIVFLGGPLSAHITGEALTIDGGASAIGPYAVGLQALRSQG